MKLLYLSVALIVLAQILGIYGLKTRKADVVFGVAMVALVVVAAVVAYVAFSNRAG